MKISERTKSDTSEPLNFPHITADTFVRRTRSSAYCALRLSPKTHHVSSRLSGATRISCTKFGSALQFQSPATLTPATHYAHSCLCQRSDVTAMRLLQQTPANEHQQNCAVTQLSYTS